MRNLIAVVALAALLAGCSPDYNWRQVQLADGAVMALFPDRPRTDSRDITYDGHKVAFALTSASVDDTLFTVAYAAFPPAMAGDTAAQKAFAADVLQSLYRNLGAAPPDALPPYGNPFFIEGKKPDGKPLKLQGAIWLTGAGLVEALVTSDKGAFPQAAADEFLRGISTAR